MKEKQLERLRPFLQNKGAQSRVILYLIGSGIKLDELLPMSVAELRALTLPVELQIYRDDMLERRKSGLAFVFPSGAPVRATDCRRLIQDTAVKVLGSAMSQSQFQAYIQSAKMGISL